MLRQAIAVEDWPWPPDSFPTGTALVGGAVRDGLLGRLGPQPDLDLVVPGDALGLCNSLSRRHGGRVVVLDAERSIARLVLRGWSLDLARQVGDDLESDLWRRDFRLNAMALPLAPGSELIDPTGGLGDLVEGELVAVREANLIDDPLRMLRGVRLAAELGFRLEPRTRGWIERHHGRISEVAPERVLQELEKLVQAPSGGKGLGEALSYGLLDPWRSSGPYPVWQPELELELTPAEAARALPLARLARVFDAASLERLRSSRQLQQRCERLRHWLLRLLDNAEGAASGLQRLGEAERLSLHQQLEEDLPALLQFFPANLAADWLARWRNTQDPLFHPRPPIDGRSLQDQLGLSPSRQLGELLAHLTHEAAYGRIQGQQEALRQARLWLEGTAA
ncbi:CCA tRNA nucleotidyltransferase [Synechococcus sp. J7-Johnson]|uniref:CCA tRNA nucleotidyltransferase n=1 Tax=Synechococcus sp. J7-Johnson TaxID=2823737 RepID=UPI0028F3FB09|nr:CCA tRNA nucleotidyltransferase [Synechococcus sp. J7-Johnson]